YHGTTNSFFNAAAATTFNNLTGATFSIDGNNDYLGLGTFSNAGTFNKSAGAAGDGLTWFAGTFTNSGVVNVDSGELRLTGNFTNYNAATDTIAAGTYNVAGVFRFQAADINVNQASITLSGAGSQIIDQFGANALADFATNDTG